VERDPTSARAARRNLHNLGRRAQVVTGAVERAEIGAADAVIADPSRAGLGRGGADTVAHTGADVVALVSCDPASFARDARLLVERGYELERIVPVDQFGNTSHIEVVAGFRRARPRASRARRPR
jgi:tRNA/tmRNA/rRNA uracil-C5-methylase (TrmA/RlmC/RlmD family)